MGVNKWNVRMPGGFILRMTWYNGGGGVCTEYGQEFSSLMKSEFPFDQSENQLENRRFCTTGSLGKATLKKRGKVNLTFNGPCIIVIVKE